MPIGVGSQQQFGGGSGVTAYGLPVPVSAPISPLSLSAQTNTSSSQRTAWRTQDANSLHPMALSTATRQSTINFDAGGQTPKVEIQ